MIFSHRLTNAAGKFRQAERAKRIIVAIVVIVPVATIGTYLTFSSHAATSKVTSAEAEAGTLTGGATVVSDPTASGGDSVSFPTGSTTTTTDGCTVSGVVAPCMNGGATGTGTSGYSTPVFDDEFNGTSLDTSSWIPGRRYGGGSTCTSACSGYNPSFEAELFDASHVSETGGNLVLTATNTSLNGGTNPWTSGTTEMQYGKNFTYGYFEARLKVPDPSTAWTSFWLSAANTWPPELDIFEFSQCNGQPTFDNHGNQPNVNVNSAGWPCSQAYGTSATDFTQWHTYGLLWTSNSLKVYFDGALQSLTTYGSGDAIPTTSMYPIFTYSIHSGTNVPNNSQMDVDYLRIWCPGGGTSCMQ
jgi:beta-glucanase (GH16 family)